MELFLADVRKMMKEECYLPRKKFALMDGNDSMNKDILCGHSEHIAIAFGILKLPKGKPFNSNHKVTKFILKLVSREIIYFKRLQPLSSF